METDSIVDMLEPLREPGAVSWWPPAPGWWLIALLTLALLGFGVYKLWLFHRRAAPLRAARKTLLSIASASLCDSEQAAALGILQRQVAIAICGRKACAGLTGQAWAEFLNSLTKSKNMYFDGELTELAYLPAVTRAQAHKAMEATRGWLHDLERPQ